MYTYQEGDKYFREIYKQYSLGIYYYLEEKCFRKGYYCNYK